MLVHLTLYVLLLPLLRDSWELDFNFRSVVPTVHRSAASVREFGLKGDWHYGGCRKMNLEEEIKVTISLPLLLLWFNALGLLLG